MSGLDYVVVALYAATLAALALAQRRRAAGGPDAYFASGRRLPWWLAGTSMIAASFATDTPLLIAGAARAQGIWGNWFWWSLGASTILSGFLFARLWRRSGVLTEPELTEIRYAGPPAALLRAFKAVYWGVLYNGYVIGALALAGLATVTEVLTGWDRSAAIFFCAGLSLVYVVAAGLWGVVAADFFQFCAAIVGSTLVAVFSIRAAGGWGAVLAAAPPEHLSFLPPLSAPSSGFWDSHLAWLAAFLGIQWWAWKNTDGGGVLVQRMVSCRDERHAVGAMLWFNVVHYAVRAWPWIAVGLASFAVLPDLADPERAYPEMIRRTLPAGLRGFVVAWFFAEFAASLAGLVNWGASLVVNDFYKRFLRPQETDAHYVRAGRAASILILAGGVGAAFLGATLQEAFKNVLHLTAGIGTVQLARWLWWRVNAAAEIAAIAASPFLVLFADDAARVCGVPPGSDLFRLLFVVVGSACAWLPAICLAGPEGRLRLKTFFFKVRPPGPGWRGLTRGVTPPVSPAPIGPDLFLWGAGMAAVFGFNFAIGSFLVGRAAAGAAWALLSAAGWAFLARRLRRGRV